jgi:hypothetical protein
LSDLLQLKFWYLLHGVVKMANFRNTNDFHLI